MPADIGIALSDDSLPSVNPSPTPVEMFDEDDMVLDDGW